MKGDKEITGTLRGFDEFVNMVLDDVTEFEITPDGNRVTKLDQILLNGNNICMMVPGGGPDDRGAPAAAPAADATAAAADAGAEAAGPDDE